MKILKKGILTTIQDLGRFNYQDLGINIGGAIDSFNFRLLNTILGNCANEAALEFHFPAPSILFEENCLFAITGADFTPKLNQSILSINKCYQARAGDILSFSYRVIGQRSYLGLKGGFISESWLNSKSTNLYLKHPIFKENESLIPRESFLVEKSFNWGISRRLFKMGNIIEFVASADFESLSEDSKYDLENLDFIITMDSNRMGYKLLGKSLNLKEPLEKVSSSVTKGTLQLLPNGQLVILMADAQVTGGYPNLGFIINSDISKLSQLDPSKKIRIKKVTLDYAIQKMKAIDLMFDKIRKSIMYAETQN